MQTSNESLIAERSVGFHILDVKWIPRTDKCLVLGTNAIGDGIIKMYELSKENQLTRVGLFAREKGAIAGGSFGMSDQRNLQLAVADAYGNIQILDLERPEAPLSSYRAQHFVTCIDGIGGNPNECGSRQLVTGGHDGSVKVWDFRQGEAQVINIQEKNPLKRSTCYAVAFANAFHDTERTVAAGYEGGALRLFDLKTHTLLWEKAEETTVCSIEFNRRDIPMNKMVVTTQNAVNVYDMNIQHSNKEFVSIRSKIGRYTTVWSIKHLPQDRNTFVTCHDEGSIRLWEYEHPAHDMGFAGSIRMEKEIQISSKGVHYFDWHPNRFGLGICASSDKIRILDLS